MRLFGPIVALTLMAVPAAAAEPKCATLAGSAPPEIYAASLTQGDANARDKLIRTIACLGDRNPAIRDAFALTVLTRALRSNGFPPEHLRAARDQLLPMLAAKGDPSGVRAPFAAMVLSEVARNDLVKPVLTAAERRQLAQAGVQYLRSVTDYRGFVDGEGWRHGVAHGADWLMQMARHPDLHPDDAAAFLTAIAAQVAPMGRHAYIHGEPRRLARPVLFLALGKKVTDEQLAGFLASLKPDGKGRWAEPYGNEAGLAAVHNVRAFASTLLIEALSSKDPAVQRLEAPVRDLLSALP